MLSDFHTDVQTGVPVCILLSYSQLFVALAPACGRAVADRAAFAAREVLSKYNIDSVPAVKALLLQLLRCTVGAQRAAEAACDVLLAAIADADDEAIGRQTVSRDIEGPPTAGEVPTVSSLAFASAPSPVRMQLLSLIHI